MTQQPPNAETLKARLATVVDLYTVDIPVLLPPGSVDQATYRFCNWSQVNGNDVAHTAAKGRHRTIERGGPTTGCS